ncbi:hypothetical protein F4820DRAFT_414210 [Hypoxylon rubiginosum]|uniref:Uncharacterized protein n=1 Tax=Hypoxylon rubiginosum TaxID=110542 RepID=A0ACB9Z647_9PEZI|nr:hypothetical protein F4820DRAFT_414210 [Hypoxylon rubiginosum]
MGAGCLCLLPFFLIFNPRSPGSTLSKGRACQLSLSRKSYGLASFPQGSRRVLEQAFMIYPVTALKTSLLCFSTLAST